MKKLTMKMITKLQRLLLLLDNRMASKAYYCLAKVHFKMHFGLDLEAEALENSDNAYLAARRHSRLVLKTLHPEISGVHKKIVKHSSIGIFTKNILLNAKT